LWSQLGNIVMQYIGAGDLFPRIGLGKINIIFNIPHSSILPHMYDNPTRSVFLLLTQDIKRDIINGHIDFPPLSPTSEGSTMTNSTYRLHHEKTPPRSTIYRTCQICQSYRSAANTLRNQSPLICVHTREFMIFSPPIVL
jgi:hypothetical protein